MPHLPTLPEPGNRLIQFDMFVIDTSSYAASFTGESVKEEIGVYETKAKVFRKYMKKAAAYYKISLIHLLGCVGHASQGWSYSF